MNDCLKRLAKKNSTVKVFLLPRLQKLFKNQLRPKKYRVKLSDIIKVSQPRSTYQPQPETEETFTLPPRNTKNSPPKDSSSEDELESVEVTINDTHQPENDTAEESEDDSESIGEYPSDESVVKFVDELFAREEEREREEESQSSESSEGEPIAGATPNTHPRREREQPAYLKDYITDITDVEELWD